MTEATRARLLEAAADWPAADRDELIEYLESDQLVEARSRPVGRRRVGPRAAALLWALRIFVVVVGAMVIYTFFAQVAS